LETIEVTSLEAEKCHTTRTANKTGNNICCCPPSQDSLSMQSECIPLLPSLEGHLYSGSFGS
jgi:hypothetical protein